VSNTVANDHDNYNYVYQYKDHLGNIRLSYGLNESQVLKTLQENHYYPYGLKHANYNTDVKEYNKDGGGSESVVLRAPPVDEDGSTVRESFKYKFNGMEWQDELGLNLYDMDMRDYDPAIGRWAGIDPVTHFDQSPYMAFNGNPITFADPSGADGEPINTWHYSGSGTSSGNGSLSSGDHMFGGSGDDFWMGNVATTGDGVAGAVSLSGNTVSIYWNSLGNGITRTGFNNGIKTGSSFLSDRAIQRLLNPKGKGNDSNQQSWENGDGYITYEEAYYTYKLSKGAEALYARLDLFDLSQVHASDFKNGVGGQLSVNFASKRFYTNKDQALVYGNITLQLMENNMVFCIKPDKYDFDLRLTPGNFKRDFLTLMGAQLNGGGVPFWIYIQGSAQIGN